MGQTTVRKGRGNSTVSKSTFCRFFFSTYKIILGIHIFFTIESDFFYIFFFGGDNLSYSYSTPGIYAHV